MKKLRFVYILYCAALIVSACFIIPSITTSGTEKLPSVSPSVYPIDPLRFYSGTLPHDAVSFMNDWFSRKGIITTQANMSIHGYTESLSIQPGETDKVITFYIDLAQPHVTYKVFVQASLSSSTDPLTYITCAEGTDQRGDATKCEGMTQI